MNKVAENINLGLLGYTVVKSFKSILTHKYITEKVLLITYINQIHVTGLLLSVTSASL